MSAVSNSGAQTYSQTFTLSGKQSAGIGIYQLPGANALQVEQAVSAKMKELARAFPQGLEYSVPFDTTVFVNASIHEVYKTLIEAAVLVLIVILVFLQDWRAMLVPATTVPVTIIGAFAMMWALGFTVNFLDVVRHRALDRYRRRRRHRRGRRRRAQYREGYERP